MPLLKSMSNQIKLTTIVCLVPARCARFGPYADRLAVHWASVAKVTR
jgi:hypothetical protein